MTDDQIKDLKDIPQNMPDFVSYAIWYLKGEGHSGASAAWATSYAVEIFSRDRAAKIHKEIVGMQHLLEAHCVTCFEFMIAGAIYSHVVRRTAQDDDLAAWNTHTLAAIKLLAELKEKVREELKR